MEVSTHALSASEHNRYNSFTMRIQDLGEFTVIDHIADLVNSHQREGSPNFDYELVVGLGDDAAGWYTNKTTELFTSDTMVEGIHFTEATTPWDDLGWKIMAANVSDIAAMGGLPTYALVTLGLPPYFELACVDNIYHGMLDMANHCKFRIVGGDMVRSPTVFITVALMGAIDRSPMERRNAAVGDQIAVTGQIGSSAGGLQLMLQGLHKTSNLHTILTEAHRRPKPHLHQGRILSLLGIKSAIDISDGLVADLSKMYLPVLSSTKYQSIQRFALHCPRNIKTSR